MTESYLKSISPDSLTGMIFALEGVRKTVVLLNGPMGCRFYHSTTSQFITVHPTLYLPLEEGGKRVPVDYSFLNDWFFRQERVPSTYLDGYDYVYGTKEKVASALSYINGCIDFDLLAIINSPGAALIGDNLLEIARSILGEKRAVMLESPGYSDSFESGYSEALYGLLKQVGPALWENRDPLTSPESSCSAGTARGTSINRFGQKDSPNSSDNGNLRTSKSVNILGLSIWQRYHEGDLQELRRLLGLCGIRLNACPCVDSSIEEIASLPDADLNLVLYPEMGKAAAEYLQETSGVPYYICPMLPIGFAATESLFKAVCGLLNVSSEALMTESEKARALAWYKIRQVSNSSGKPKGVRFHVDGNSSQIKAYESFLAEYLGMVPSGPDCAELVFSDANLISELMLKNKTFCGIEINLPGMGYIDLVTKTHLGINGSLFLIEQVLNGLMSRL